MGRRKKKWSAPRLIVLRRAQPEEQVLLACKSQFAAGPQRPGNWGCLHPAHGPCQAQANS